MSDWTPERHEALRQVCQEYQSLNTVEKWREIVEQRSSALPDALKEIERLQARWEALKAELWDYVNQRGDEATSTYRLGAKSMAQTAVDIMARRERALGTEPAQKAKA